MTQPLVRAEPASSLSLCFISLSLSLVFFLFSFSFFQQGRTSTILGMQGFVARCIPITPTLSLSFFFFQFTWGEVFFFLFGCFPHAETAWNSTPPNLFSDIYIKPLVEALND